MARGKLITLEGGEGAGKTTQARLLAAHLGRLGIPTVVTREPGGSPFAEVIRDLLLSGRLPPHDQLAEALLFSAARADHLAHTIRPALAAGRWVISDRFTDSTRVYQGAGGGLSADAIRQLEALVLGPDQPDLTIVIDLPIDIGLGRAAARSGSPAHDPYEGRERAFHERLRAGFLDLARSEPGRVVVVDGAQPPEQIGTEIAALVERRLGTARA
jgi:dTMP kinase